MENVRKSNAHVGIAEKRKEGLLIVGKREKIKFYLDRLDRVFEEEPIEIEGLIHAVNFGMDI